MRAGMAVTMSGKAAGRLKGKRRRRHKGMAGSHLAGCLTGAADTRREARGLVRGVPVVWRDRDAGDMNMRGTEAMDVARGVCMKITGGRDMDVGVVQA